jgi:hypothetical protein
MKKEWQALKVCVDGKIGHARLNEPQVLNALDCTAVLDTSGALQRALGGDVVCGSLIFVSLKSRFRGTDAKRTGEKLRESIEKNHRYLGGYK